MTTYEKLLSEYGEKLDITEQKMINDGLYGDGCVWIKKDMPINKKACILAEELGHHYTTVGNILDQSDIPNQKQERIARGWAYNKLVPLDSIKHAHSLGYTETYEMADYLEVDEAFLKESLKYYEEKHGDELLRERQEQQLED